MKAVLNVFIENTSETAFTIKKLTLSTFSKIDKLVKLEIQGKVAQLTAGKYIFERAFMSQQRNNEISPFLGLFNLLALWFNLWRDCLKITQSCYVKWLLLNYSGCYF